MNEESTVWNDSNLFNLFKSFSTRNPNHGKNRTEEVATSPMSTSLLIWFYQIMYHHGWMHTFAQSSQRCDELTSKLIRSEIQNGYWLLSDKGICKLALLGTSKSYNIYLRPYILNGIVRMEIRTVYNHIKCFF